MTNGQGPAFGTSEAQKVYVKLVQDRDMVWSEDADDLYAILESYDMRSLSSAILAARDTSEQELATLQNTRNLASEEFRRCLGDLVLQNGIVTYALKIQVEDITGARSGNFDVRRDGKEVYLSSDAMEGFFEAVITLGVICSGGLTLRTFSKEGPVVYGWWLGNNGLVGLSEAEIFDAHCTDATTGEPIPPEARVTYAGVPQ
jgi:hypothetical protein